MLAYRQNEFAVFKPCTRNGDAVGARVAFGSDNATDIYPAVIGEYKHEFALFVYRRADDRHSVFAVGSVLSVFAVYAVLSVLSVLTRRAVLTRGTSFAFGSVLTVRSVRNAESRMRTVRIIYRIFIDESVSARLGDRSDTDSVLSVFSVFTVKTVLTVRAVLSVFTICSVRSVLAVFSVDDRKSRCGFVGKRYRICVDKSLTIRLFNLFDTVAGRTVCTVLSVCSVFPVRSVHAVLTVFAIHSVSSVCSARSVFAIGAVRYIEKRGSAVVERDLNLRLVRDVGGDFFDISYAVSVSTRSLDARVGIADPPVSVLADSR